VVTDAKVAAADLEAALRTAVNASFNRVTWEPACARFRSPRIKYWRPWQKTTK